jgi:membrane protease subunit (stomatin/prohibitin family)
MGIVGDLDRYTRLQAANAIADAARNPGGGAGEGLGLGLGMAVGQQMAASLNTAGAPAGPPPMPAQQQWYTGVGGQQRGPFDLAELAAQAASGALTPATLVWKSGMAQWAPAQQVPELTHVFGGPPPLPQS